MTRTQRILLIVAAATGVSAGLPGGPSADDLLRAGVAALRRGEPAAADALLAAAEEGTDDPGLVAVNRAAAAAGRGDWGAAEGYYARALADGECPPERRARAGYDRGVCRLRRGGAATRYRAACADFEACRDTTADPALAADARHNLELAKLLYQRARAAERPSPPPPDLPPESAAPPPAAGPDGGGAPDPGAGAGGAGGRVEATGGAVPPGAGAAPTDDGRPGAGSVPVVPDVEELKPLSPAELRAVLARAAGRLERDRAAAARLRGGGARPGVRDW